MNTHFSFKHLTESEKTQVQEYFEKKSDVIAKHVRVLQTDALRMDIRAEKFPTKAAYKMHLTLHAPKRTFIASEDDHTIPEAVDLALDKLKIQISKYHEKIISE